MKIYYNAKKQSDRMQVCVTEGLKYELEEKRCSKDDYRRILSSPFKANSVNFNYLL